MSVNSAPFTITFLILQHISTDYCYIVKDILLFLFIPNVVEELVGGVVRLVIRADALESIVVMLTLKEKIEKGMIRLITLLIGWISHMKWNNVTILEGGEFV